VTSSRPKIGIIAGSGELPIYVTRSLAVAGEDLYVAALKGAAEKVLEDARWKTGWYQIHNLQELVDGLRREGVTGVVLAGRVAHTELFSTTSFDISLKSLLETLPDHRAATILTGIVKLFQSNGMEVLSMNDVVPGLMPPIGHLAGPPPQTGLPGGLAGDLASDLAFGWRIARSVADLDIGQTVVVKNRSVVAVEAMEGTDVTIERAVKVAGGGVTVVKLAARNHDFRYDVPTVGKDTVSRIAGGGGGTLAVESGRCMILGIDEVTTLCDEGGVTLLSCKESEGGEILWDG
jgi:DUF1009 family protein